MKTFRNFTFAMLSATLLISACSDSPLTADLSEAPVPFAADFGAPAGEQKSTEIGELVEVKRSNVAIVSERFTGMVRTAGGLQLIGEMQFGFANLDPKNMPKIAFVPQPVLMSDGSLLKLEPVFFETVRFNPETGEGVFTSGKGIEQMYGTTKLSNSDDIEGFITLYFGDGSAQWTANQKATVVLSRRKAKLLRAWENIVAS
jgi:hypothetical protein